MAGVLIRGGIVVGAVLVIAWLAFSIHVVDLQAKGETVLDQARRGPVSAADVDSARADLQDASRHNPDLTPLLDEGYLLQASGRRSEAAVVALRAISKEPENVQGWTLLALSAPDESAREFALQRIKRLNVWLGVDLATRWQRERERSGSG